MLLSEIKPIDVMGRNLLNEKEPQYYINNIIELTLRKACSIFVKKGIKTLMSSANKDNIPKAGEKAIEKEDLYKDRYIKDPSPMFDEAGKGYAWIMLDFNSLSDENKDWLFSLEERTDENNQNIGERAIWFIQPSEKRTIEYCIQTGQLTYEDLEGVYPENEIPKGVKLDERLAKFYDKHVVLAYNWAMYSFQSVLLRMPVNEQTTVEEVEEYFAKFAESFRDQIKEKDIDEQQSR